MFSGDTRFGKTAISILAIAFIVISSTYVSAYVIDGDEPEDAGDIPYAWINIGTMPDGMLDYDGKVSNTVGVVDYFDGFAEADVTLGGNGSVKAYSKKYRHEAGDSSLGMASQTYKPFTITSNILSNGQTVSCTTTVTYDGFIVLREQTANNWSAGQIDFLFEITTDGDNAVVANDSTEVSYEGQLRIQDTLDGVGGHTYGITTPNPVVSEDVIEGETPGENYWSEAGSGLTVTSVPIGDISGLPDDVEADAVAYNVDGNKIYYVNFSKTVTYTGEVGKTYYVYMDAHSAAQTSDAAGTDVTFVVCDFSNTVEYDTSMGSASAQTVSVVSGADDFGVGGTGDIELNGGILQWDQDVSLGYGFALGNGTTSVLDTQSNTGAVTGILSGTGGLTKEGAGTLVLTAANTYSGATTVSEGGLVVNNTFASPITVNSGAWLGGGVAGKPLSGAVVNSGTLKPGNSIGTLELGNGYTQESGGQLEIEIANDETSDTLDVTGTATLDGTLYVQHTEMITGTKNYADIVSASVDLSGTFDTVTGSGALLYTYSAVEDASENIDLTVSKTGSFSDYSSSATGGVAGILDSAYGTATGEMATVLDAIASMSSGAAAEQAFSELMPTNIINTTTTTAISSSNLFSGAVQKHISKARTGNNIAIAGLNKPERWLASNSKDATTYLRHRDYDTPAQGFVKTYGSKGDRESDGSKAGYGFEIYGTALGIDKLVDDNLLAGFALGYSNGNVGSSDNLTQNSLETFSTSIYGSWFNLDSYIDVVVGYGHNWHDVSRRINPGGLEATSNPESDMWSSSITAGKAFFLDDMTVEPFVGFSYSLLQSQGFTESGAGNVSLSVSKNSIDSTNSVLGIRMAKYIVIKNKPLATELTLAWKHDFSGQVQTSSKFVGSNTSFSTKGLDTLRDSMIAAVGVEANLSENSKLFVKYDTELNGQYQSHTGQIGVKVTF